MQKLTFDDALRIARGCTDYGGGHRSNAEHYEIYQHGIQTVINSLTAASNRGLEDTQVSALHVMGANAKVSGAGTASDGLTGSAAGGLEKGEAMDMAWADKQLPPGVTRQDVCIWTQDSDGPWCGSCGVMWEFIDGGPKDNETHFCPRCGGVLLAEPFAEDETPNTK